MKIKWDNPITKGLRGVYPLFTFPNEKNSAIEQSNTFLGNAGGSGFINPVSSDRGPATYIDRQAASNHKRIEIAQEGLLRAGGSGNPSDSFTASIWCKFDGTSGQTHDIMGQWNYTSAMEWIVTGPHSTGTNFFASVRHASNSDDTNFQSTGVNAADGEWHHVVFTFEVFTGVSNDVMTLFIDGDKYIGSNSTVPGIFDTTSNITLGGQLDGTNSYDGYLQNFCFWRRALTRAEVKSLYQDPWQMMAPQRFFVPMIGEVTVTETPAGTTVIITSAGTAGTWTDGDQNINISGSGFV